MQRQSKRILVFLAVALSLALAAVPGPGPAAHRGQRRAARRPSGKLMEPADHRHAGFAQRHHHHQRETAAAA